MKLAHTSGDTLEAIRWRPIVQPAALMRTWLALQRHERVEHAQSKALLGLHVRTLPGLSSRDRLRRADRLDVSLGLRLAKGPGVGAPVDQPARRLCAHEP